MKKLYAGMIVLLCITIIPLAASAQSKQVKGKVTSGDGPMPGVSIQIKGTATGTSTDVNGDYTLVVEDDNAVLVFSFIGYLTEEVPVNGRSVVDMLLMEDITTLSEVVVVGYGTDSKKNLTSSVSTIKAGDLNRGAISDVGQLLQGKVPGLNITRSGDPNRTAAIIMRGASTLRDGAQSPLFVIDGVIGADISLLAPDDIVSIDVLKDASATAIYGNRGANGVIMVTTKRPKSGIAELTYSGYVAAEKVSSQYEMMDANQLRGFIADNNLSLNPTDDTGANTNWQDEVQRSTAITHNHNLSLTGGTEKTSYVAGLNYFNQEGIIRNSGLKRIVAKMGVEHKAFRDKLTIGLNVTNSFNDAQYVPYRNTVLAQMLTYLPTVPVRNADNSYFIFSTNNHTNDHNPVAMMESAEERSRYNTFLGSMKIQLELPFNLKYNLQASYQSLTTNYGAYYDSYFTSTFESVRSTPDPPGNPSFINIAGANGLAVRNTYQYTNTIFENFLSWDKEFGQHTVNAVVGYSWQENTNGDGFQTSSTNFYTDDTGYNNLALGNPYAIADFRVDYGSSSAYDQIRLISDFARVKYSYLDRYLLQLSIRRDGSSAFGKNNRWGYFPSAGIAWRIWQENFLSGVEAVTDLKLRGSYGVTGNSAGFSAYISRLLYGVVGTTEYKGNNINAIGAIQNENPDLRWEKTATANIGVDFALFSNRISGSFDIYDKRTTDVIYPYPVSTNLYLYSSLLANVGEVSNRGYEISLTGEVVNTTDFSWSTTLNLAHNKNKIVSLSNDVFQADSIRIFTPDGGGQSGLTIQALMSGQPLGTFYTFQYAGKNENGVSQYVQSDGTLTASANNLGVEDYYVVGNAQPKLMLGWTNSVRYKSFDLNLFFRGVFGNKIMNVTRADLFRPSTAQINNIPVEVAAESVNDVNSFRYSSRFVEKGDYLRLDNATLGYNFKKMGPDIKKLRLYVGVNNLFTITGYKGIDPEINQGGIAPGVDARNFYPKTRTFLAGVVASF